MTKPRSFCCACGGTCATRLRYRDLEEMRRERGLSVDQTTIYRWVQHDAPELEKRCKPHLKATTDSWRVDETYSTIRKTWMDLYRAVDVDGNPLEFLLSPTRDAEAATRFFVKALQSTACSVSPAATVEEEVDQPTAPADLPASRSTLRVMNAANNAVYPKAIAELKAAGMLAESVELRQVISLNTLIEQDHRCIKRLVKPGMGFFSFETAWRTLQGYEGHAHDQERTDAGSEQRDVHGQVAFIATLFGVAA